MLRPYQEKAIAEIRAHFRTGQNKVLLHLSTGSGKTLIFNYMLTQLAKNGKRGLLVVRGRHLVDQTSERLTKDSVPHGVIMAGHRLFSPDAPIQICSIDTLSARKIFPETDFVVIDEAHLASSSSFINFLANYQSKFILGVSATPYGNDSLRHIADHVVRPVTTKQLIEQKYLVPLRHFCHLTPNLKGVHTRAGDFVTEELEPVMNKLVGDTVGEWKKHAGGMATIVFAVNIAHSNKIKEAFNDAGVPCEHVEAGTSLEERKKILGKLESGELKVVTNVGILCTGVDMPYLRCIVMARPTKSYNLYIQQLGRGTRPFKEKDFCLILDHASNTKRHGFITDERSVCLDGKNNKEKIESPTSCPSCYYIWYKSQEGPVCPNCSEELPASVAKKKIEVINGELVEVKELSKLDQARLDLKNYKKEAKQKGYKSGWAYYRIVTKYGSEIAQQISPQRKVPAWIKR